MFKEFSNSDVGSSITKHIDVDQSTTKVTDAGTSTTNIVTFIGPSFSLGIRADKKSGLGHLGYGRMDNRTKQPYPDPVWI